MPYKITYYKDGELDKFRTIRSHLVWQTKYYLKFHILPFLSRVDRAFTSKKLSTSV